MKIEILYQTGDDDQRIEVMSFEGDVQDIKRLHDLIGSILTAPEGSTVQAAFKEYKSYGGSIERIVKVEKK